MLHSQLKKGVRAQRKVKTRGKNMGINSRQMKCKVIQSNEITPGERTDCRSRLNTKLSEALVRLEENQESTVPGAKWWNDQPCQKQQVEWDEYWKLATGRDQWWPWHKCCSGIRRLRPDLTGMGSRKSKSRRNERRYRQRFQVVLFYKKAFSYSQTIISYPLLVCLSNCKSLLSGLSASTYPFSQCSWK